MPVPQPNWVVTVGLGKETTWGTAVPVTSFLSSPTPSFDEKQDTIFDKGLRGIRSETQAMSFGAGHSEISLPDMPMYADDSGHLFMGMLGTDTINAYAAKVGTLAIVSAPGQASVAYTTGTGGASATGDVFKVLDGANSEVVKPTSVAAGTWTMPTTGPGSFKYAHPAGVTVNSLAEHTMTVLNTGQPPSYTLQKYDALITTARTLAGCYFEEVSVKYTNPGKLALAAKARGKMGVQAAKVTASYSTESFMVPWQTSVTLNNVLNAQVVDLEFTIKAPVDLIYGMNATQSPTAAVSDQLSVTGKMTIVPGDYTEFLYYINNTQPALLIESDNGATQAVFQMSKVAFIDPMALSHSGNFTMLNATFEAISNSTDGVGSNAPFRTTLANLKTTAY